MSKRDTRTPAPDRPEVDYQTVALAIADLREEGDTRTSEDAVTAAYRRLSRCGYLSQIADPRTHYALRPSQYTPAEMAVVSAWLSEFKGAYNHSVAEWAPIQAHIDQMKRTRVEPEIEPAARTVEKDWFESTMNESEIRQWLALRAEEEIAACKIAEEGYRWQKLMDNGVARRFDERAHRERASAA